MKNKEQLKEQWEEILGIDFEQELLIYKNLCGILRKREQKRLRKDQWIDRYKVWGDRIAGYVKPLEMEQLKELSHYIKIKIRDMSIYDDIFKTYFIPLLIAISGNFVFSVLLNKVTDINRYTEVTGIVIILFFYIVLFFVTINVMTKKVVEHKGDIYIKYFFEDMADIISEETERRQ